MADINGIDNIISQYAKTSTTTQATGQTLGKEDFLKMLVAQLKNQDPLNPMSGTDFAVQLAQFSSLEQLYNLNTGIKNLGVYQMSQANLQAVSLIGKEVSAAGGDTFEAAGGPVDIAYDLAGDAAAVTLTIQDEAGRLIDTIRLNDQRGGLNTVTWGNGSSRTGTHKVRITATNAEGGVVTATPLVQGKVTAVSFKDQAVYVTVGGKEIAFTDIKQVKQG
ncbi:MAG TPA: flagellar hook assembly protein FlgD [Syntrophales bacterium]|nr:flagellar hook assembly protein FlgD [Syntrophales bacterium]HOM07607.1 flagellar hook assembly protein FlgD [Syntrophales bacterium]HON99426.1 flagellar hook assembly protein FlgD [Syntrophales bacterium]HPC00537.1 flagellar hook assembly protein FlgD [Syntrophales bacterium]HPQ06708.1 flagellar hook assembly protein FlgD [Syntrophales bacterium]